MYPAGGCTALTGAEHKRQHVVREMEPCRWRMRLQLVHTVYAYTVNGRYPPGMHTGMYPSYRPSHTPGVVKAEGLPL